MLHDPARHEALRDEPWHAERARSAIAWIVRDTLARWTPERWWPMHPKDLDARDDPAQLATPLYHGAAGVVWALRYLHALGVAPQPPIGPPHMAQLMHLNRAWLSPIPEGQPDEASLLMGDTPFHLMAHADDPAHGIADALAALIERNLDHPARELMWGAPGTLLAAGFLHDRTGDERWAQLVRRSAERLWSQLQWSDEHGCRYWTQDLYGRRSTYLDGVHGFVATAHGLIRNGHLLDAAAWAAWQEAIVQTIAATATREGGGANWRAQLQASPQGAPRLLMQFCHGAPGFIVCLAGLPPGPLDALLLEAGEAVWAAGPLAKGSNLCHGTAGNGYAFLKLFERTGDERWLQRARAFAMHAIGQTEADAGQVGHLRYSLWTGDLGLAIYLWDCLHAGQGKCAFPTLDAFDAPQPAGA
jgi:hypothetical protein